MLAVVTEILADGRRRIGRDVLHRRGIGSGGRDNHRVIHGPGFGQRLDVIGDGRGLLPNRYVDANQVVALSVDDGIERHRGLTSLAVADDQLTLAAADRNHAVDGLQAGLHRLFHRRAVDDARRDFFDRVELIAEDWPAIVDRLAERVDHAADHGVAYRHRHDALGALDYVAFFDLVVVAEQHRANLVFFQIHGDAVYFVRKFEQFPGHPFFH